MPANCQRSAIANSGEYRISVWTTDRPKKESAFERSMIRSTTLDSLEAI
jgi:hypothetical protein